MAIKLTYFFLQCLLNNYNTAALTGLVLHFKYLYNNKRHSYICMLRIDGWNDWAEIFCRHSWVAYFFQFFFQGQLRALQLVLFNINYSPFNKIIWSFCTLKSVQIPISQNFA